MLTIRFQRVGRRNDPAFRIVVTEKRSKPKSGELEILGSYHPKTRETRFKAERILHWLSKGAKASPRVHNLLISRGVTKGRKIPVSPRVSAPPPPSGESAPLEKAPMATAPPEQTEDPRPLDHAAVVDGESESR